MDQRSTDRSEQVHEFTPNERPRNDGDPMEEPGQAIVAKIRRASAIANENCDRAMALAHKLAIQARAAEDRIYQLENEVKHFQDRAVRAEHWLQVIHKEIEEKLIAPMTSQRSSLQ